MADPNHVEPLRAEVAALLPAVGVAELFRFLPVIERLLALFQSGTGSFSTWTPRGRRWVIVTDRDPSLP
jgi:hypothetical protein